MDVRDGSMLLKKDFERAAGQFWFKKPVVRATLIRTAGLFDSIVAHSALAADFFNSIRQKRKSRLEHLLSAIAPKAGADADARRFPDLRKSATSIFKWNYIVSLLDN
jgi:hypothetical protein